MPQSYLFLYNLKIILSIMFFPAYTVPYAPLPNLALKLN